MICIADCPVYKDFLNITSLKSSKTFMNGGSNDIGRDGQVDTIYRARAVCRDCGFKSVQHEDIRKQYELACDALKEK